MGEPKGDRLYVNLGASQVRRRLKAFGHGVRKVQSIGRNQSLIIHTATGQHLTELTDKFADVGYANRESELNEPVENLRNLGPASAAWLRDAGITSIKELRNVGAATAYLMVKRAVPRASLNLLWALAAGLKDRDWRDLTDAEKQGLIAKLDQ
ncbi:MAG: TfoX/Sxy family protein [Planctomycetales bacterium]|nr:TfoX/Sxy family protein [Planctomycetales bacterium]